MSARNTHRGRAPKSMGKTAARVLGLLRQFYPVMLPAVAICILVQCVVQAAPNIFMERCLTVVGEFWESGDWATAQPQVFTNAAILAVMYFASLVCNAVWQQCMAIITQGALKKFRCLMFDHMQDLPIKYFDTHQHGDIMSYYTNDVDALRQMIAQSLPQLFLTMLMLISVSCIMIYYSLPLTLVVVGGAAIMAFLAKTLAGRSARNFLRTQRAVATVEGHVEEVMNGEKVVKVFCHERQTEAAFDKLNDELEAAARAANSYANTLMPILMNMGNLLYVVVAVASGIFLVVGAPNPSLSGMPLTIAVAVPFLNMTKQFANQIGQISNQVNSVVMGLAGAERIFELLDEEPEQDEGYVELVACTIDGEGSVRECDRRDADHGERQQHHAEHDDHHRAEQIPSALGEHRITRTHIRHDAHCAARDDDARHNSGESGKHRQRAKHAYQAEYEQQGARNKAWPIDRPAVAAGAKFVARIQNLHADVVITVVVSHGVLFLLPGEQKADAFPARKHGPALTHGFLQRLDYAFERATAATTHHS